MPTLVPMDIHNCFRELKENETETTTKYHVDGFMRELIQKLVRKHPDWQFVANGYRSERDPDRNIDYFSRFNIFSDDEELGWLGKERHDYDLRFCFDGPRLKAKRSRGYHNASKDTAKAFKTINENIYGKTVAEKAGAASGLTTSTVSRIQSAASNAMYGANRDLTESMRQFCLDNWDAFCAMPMSAGVAQQRDQYLTITQTSIDADKLTAAKNGSPSNKAGGVTVMIMANDRYLLIREGVQRQGHVTPFTVKNPEDLHPHVRQGVGMLKLIANGEMIPDVGARADAKTFFVLVPEGMEI